MKIKCEGAAAAIGPSGLSQIKCQGTTPRLPGPPLPELLLDTQQADFLQRGGEGGPR